MNYREVQLRTSWEQQSSCYVGMDNWSSWGTLIQLAAQRRCKCGGILMEGLINLEYLGTSKVFAM